LQYIYIVVQEIYDHKWCDLHFILRLHVTEEFKSSYEVLGRMKEVTEVGVKWLIRLYFFYKAFKLPILCFRCLCLAGCNIEQKNGDGIKAEITALKYGYNDICNLLSRLRNVCFLSITEFLISFKKMILINGKLDFYGMWLTTS
jgi:hypothetical protein